MLLRVPGIGVKSARRIVQVRRVSALTYDTLKKLGVVLRRAQFFIVCGGKRREGLRFKENEIARYLLPDAMPPVENRQLSLFDPRPEDIRQCITGQI